MNNLTQSLFNKYTQSSQSLLHNKKYLKPECNSLFDELVKKIHLRNISINNYVKMNKQERKRKYEISIKNNNFEITYLIHQDLSSELIVSYFESQKNYLNSNFIEAHVDLDKTQYVYFIKSEYGFKIGKTKDLKQRINYFGVKLPFNTELHSYIETKRMDDCELFFHQLFYDRRLNGEWFSLTNDDFETISILCKNWGIYNINKK